MKPEMRIVMLRHLLAVLAVLGVAVVLTMAGMNPAAAAGAAGVSVAAAEAATRRRASRCPTSGTERPTGRYSRRGRVAPGLRVLEELVAHLERGVEVARDLGLWPSSDERRLRGMHSRRRLPLSGREVRDGVHGGRTPAPDGHYLAMEGCP